MSVEFVAKKFPAIEFVEDVPLREKILSVLETNPSGVLLADLEAAVGGTSARFYKELSDLVAAGAIIKGKAMGKVGRFVTAYRLNS